MKIHFCFTSASLWKSLPSRWLSINFCFEFVYLKNFMTKLVSIPNVLLQNVAFQPLKFYSPQHSPLVGFSNLNLPPGDCCWLSPDPQRFLDNARWPPTSSWRRPLHWCPFEAPCRQWRARYWSCYLLQVIAVTASSFGIVSATTIGGSDWLWFSYWIQWTCRRDLWCPGVVSGGTRSVYWCGASAALIVTTFQMKTSGEARTMTSSCLFNDLANNSVSVFLGYETRFIEVY